MSGDFSRHCVSIFLLERCEEGMEVSGRAEEGFSAEDGTLSSEQ